MIYTLDSLEIKTSKAKKPYALTFWKDEEKHEYKALMFQDFEGLTVGERYEGEIRPYQDAAVFNMTKHETTRVVPKSTAGFKRASIEMAQERRERGIASAQDNKQYGIMLAAAFRDATLLLVHDPAYTYMTPRERQIEHKRLRELYVVEWREAEKDWDVPFD